VIRQIAALLDRIGAGGVVADGGGSDIEPLMASGVPGMSPDVDESRYFWYHHTEADTIEKLDAHEMALCVATMAVMAYVVADMPEPLPRATVTP
jgi:carboxypeptidase Q